MYVYLTVPECNFLPIEHLDIMYVCMHLKWDFQHIVYILFASKLMMSVNGTEISSFGIMIKWASSTLEITVKNQVT